ncbi:RTA1-domain-containing protein [Xylaria bambusicola]|uniref:RTA1-domain-containing protein n=1 Tax=Xylaria bambusicola TaxID=326684 RepID=UPI00200741DD|nr:RTA1-domain-containing protein [Xylaria bambusicola]KAI0517646.1 RTA1-domain-containing protein [Xylaria bambusicola]
MDGDQGPFGPVVNGTMVVVFYQYRPSEIAGYAFLGLFAIATLAHIVYLFILRAWWFIPFILGGIAEVFGYYGRALSHDQPDVVGPWILQNLLLLTAPPLISATIYMTLGRLATAVDSRRCLPVTPRLLTPLYVLLDVGVVGTQLAGSVLPASGEPSAIELSKKLVLSGLLAQAVALTIFILIAWFVEHRIKQISSPTIVLNDNTLAHWGNHFRAIQGVTLLIIVRSIVRTVEYVQGPDGFVISHEAFIYIFDAVLMWLVMAIYTVLHPGRLVRDTRRQKNIKGAKH